MVFTELQIRVFDDNSSYFSLKPYVVTPHLNCLVEMVQMMGSQHMFLCRIKKNYPKLSPYTPSYLELCTSKITLMNIVYIKYILK